jgi:hypothetical protein
MGMNTDRLTAEHQGAQVFDLSDASKIKTVQSFGTKNGPSGEDTLLINFTDGTWAYAEMTEAI